MRRAAFKVLLGISLLSPVLPLYAQSPPAPDNSRFKAILQERAQAYTVEGCADIFRQATALEEQVQQLKKEIAEMNQKGEVAHDAKNPPQ